MLTIEGILAAILLGFSGLFSGLTLGLLGLDIYSLEITLASDSVQSKYAARILPLRRRGNLLLCTLLFANVAVNTALPILLTRLFGEVGSLLLSISLIVVVGEIIPQAICSRHALLIGAHSIYLVYLLVAIFFPVAYPISKMLDAILGDELGQLYTRKELQKLVEMHHKSNHVQQLHKDEFNIMTGALQFGQKMVHEIMTPLSAFFSVDINARLDFETMQSIFESGYSRIPVMERMQNGKPNVVGILYAKDLILVDPDDALPVRHILSFYCRTVHFVFSDTNLERMFSEFKSGRSHIAIVVDGAGNGLEDSYYEIRGLITLEDIAEVIFQDSIFDETDIAPAPTSRQICRQWLLRPPFIRQPVAELESPELDAVYFHLKGVYPKVFEAISEEFLRALLHQSHVYEVSVPDLSETTRFCDYGQEIESDLLSRRSLPVDKGGLSLYQYGQNPSFMAIILDGRVHVQFGADHFDTNIGRWSIIGLPQFERDVDHFLHGQQLTGFESVDFTAYVVRKSRILCIDREMFRRFLRRSASNSYGTMTSTPAGPDQTVPCERSAAGDRVEEYFSTAEDRSINTNMSIVVIHPT